MPLALISMHLKSHTHTHTAIGAIDVLLWPIIVVLQVDKVSAAVALTRTRGGRVNFIGSHTLHTEKCQFFPLVRSCLFLALTPRELGNYSALDTKLNISPNNGTLTAVNWENCVIAATLVRTRPENRVECCEHGSGAGLL